jgi:transposase-like protein
MNYVLRIVKAIYEVFGNKVLIQRSQWHKRDNVVGYLPKSVQTSMRQKLQEVYQESTYEKAKEKLAKIRKQLELINQSAVSSLDEGMEKTLILHCLGLLQESGVSFRTTIFTRAPTKFQLKNGLTSQ